MGYLVHYHYVGVSSESYSAEGVLRRLVKFMHEHLKAFPDRKTMFWYTLVISINAISWLRYVQLTTWHNCSVQLFVILAENFELGVKLIDKLSALMKKLRWLGSKFDKNIVIVIDGLNMVSKSLHVFNTFAGNTC